MAHRISSFKAIVNTFEQSAFIPPSGWFRLLTRNNHWQTIVGSEAIRNKLFKVERNFQTTEERFDTDCGDFFDVEYSIDFETNEKVVILLHGLESNIKGPLITRMATAYASKGFGFCLVSFRGCNGVDNDSPGSYHFGFTQDVDFVTRTIHERFPTKKIYLSGFSLGGNVILKYLGELGDNALSLNVIGGIATCVPFNPIECQPKLDTGFNRAIYSENFLKTLKEKAELKIKRFPDAFDIETVRQCKTIGDFDQAFIAPIYGFKDKYDYYRQTGSLWWLPKIRVPTIVINALDDPFVEESSLPTLADIGPTAPVRVIYHAYGGHCGFKADQPPAPHGWLAEEMSLALSHIDRQYERFSQANASFIFS